MMTTLVRRCKVAGPLSVMSKVMGPCQSQTHCTHRLCETLELSSRSEKFLNRFVRSWPFSTAALAKEPCTMQSSSASCRLRDPLMRAPGAPNSSLKFKLFFKMYCSVPVINLDAGQPTAETHPEVLQPGEIMPGVTFEEMSSRRKKLMSALPFGSIVILISASVKDMTELIPYPYRQNSDYLYYTGCTQPEGIALLYGAGELCMFMPDPFIEGCFWEGRWAHAPEAITVLKADRAYNISDLPKHLPRLLKQGKGVYIDGEVLPGSELGKLPAYKEAVQENKVHSLSKYSHEARWIKSSSELNLMRQAAGMACQAFLQTMKVSPLRQHEHLLAATIEYECKVRGAQRMAFPPVVAGGANATVIHYSRNDQPIKEGQMVLMDAGCDYFGYVSDITRTWCPSGTLNNAQRDIYEAVLSAFKHCLELYKPGSTLAELHHAASDKLRKAAKELGIIRSSDDYLKINPTCVGHYLGMDVHDCKAIPENRRLEPGVVLTIEPGLYVPESDQFPKWCRGIGIRIEDEVLITDSGHEVLTASIPKELGVSLIFKDKLRVSRVEFMIVSFVLSF
ncbi:hypothetical protein GOP47_0027242 [Adiantum capillus-veneris]|nr:hypothetical protein GOP47_0027242 [Adiantum capillus-veneris]